MAKPGGYAGRVLRVNLTTETWQEEFYPEEILRQYIGGSGLAAKILFDETDEKTEPLGPDNVLIFMTGPLAGTKAPMSGRHAVVAKSPLTGIWGESDCGGSFGVALKGAGYDGVIINGQATRPVYLYLDNGKVEIRDAAHLWGKDTYVLEELIRQETSKDVQVACIGVAGELMVKYAGIFSDGKDARAAGRSGLGAVMGSKSLKAIAARGSFKPEIRHPEKLKEAMKSFIPEVSQNMKGMTDYGTTVSHVATEECGDMPIKNWLAGSFREGAERTSGQAMVKTGVLQKNYYCNSCFVGCGRVVKIDSGKFAPVEGAGPEYESMSALGSYCLVDDLDAVCKATELCNRYGMDTISTGGVVAFAMELYEKGLLTKEQTGGLELTWGNGEALVGLIHKIGTREGIGDLLAEGVRTAAEKIGGLAAEYAIHVKGMELPAHDPRAFFVLGVQYATSNRGGCHLSSYADCIEKGVTMPELGWEQPVDRFEVKGKGILNAKMGDLCSLFDSLKTCKFLLWGGGKANHLLEWLNAVTGFGMSLEEFMTAGERIFNLKRMYNVRLGISRKDDTLPARLLSSKRGTGGAAATLPPLGEMLNEFYQHRGWSEEGIPTPETLSRLNLEFTY